MPRQSPYAAFNFLVNFGPGAELGGFSDVSDLNRPTDISAYREGGEKRKPGGKTPGLHKTASLTLKRGVVDARQFSAWLEAAKSRGAGAGRAVTLVLRDAKGAPLRQWKLQGAWPEKITGPSFSAKNNEVAIDELVLSGESLDLE